MSNSTEQVNNSSEQLNSSPKQVNKNGRGKDKNGREMHPNSLNDLDRRWVGWYVSCYQEKLGKRAQEWQGMFLNSLKDLASALKALKDNNHAKKDYSITHEVVNPGFPISNRVHRHLSMIK